MTAQHARAGYGALHGLTGAATVRQRRARSSPPRPRRSSTCSGSADIRDRRIGGLPYGTLKLLELGCALATDPDLLLLDEPSSGHGPGRVGRARRAAAGACAGSSG